MVNIIIGCPYTQMANLTKAFLDISDNNINVINSNDVKAFDFQCLYIGDKLQEIDIDTIHCSFLRYPYDLIPPHSETYILREEIEYYKSIIFSVDTVSINSLASTWELRNRYHSLMQAKKAGVNVSQCILISGAEGVELLREENYAVKAIGNCFITENANTINDKLRSFSEIAKEQDGDEAAIFPASLFETRIISKYVDTVGYTFAQDPILTEKEYRCYIIGETQFIYRRENIGSFDKSTAMYKNDSYRLSAKTFSGIKKLMKKYNLDYICFDMIKSKNDEEVVIDINPYGAMPNFENYPEPSIKLANIIIDKAKYNKTFDRTA